MAQSQADPEHVSTTGSPNDLVVRSNPYNDLRPFIEHLWRTQESMCRNVYPDQFPPGKNGSATKEEEDEFLLSHFSPSTMQSHGGRFLKQALYSIASYNEDAVLEFVARWAAKNREYYEDGSVLMGMCGDVAEIKHFFDASECVGRADSFLERAIKVIRYGLRQLQEVQSKERTVEAPAQGSEVQPTILGRVEILQRTRDLPAAIPFPSSAPVDPVHKLADVQVPGAAPQIRTSHDKPFDTPQAETVQPLLPATAPQPSSTRLEARQPYRHGRASLRHMSGNMYASPPTTVPFPVFTQNMAGPATTRNTFPDFDPSMVVISDHHGYLPIGQPVMTDSRFIGHNMSTPPDQYGPHGYELMTRQENITLMDPHSHPRSNGAPFVYHQNSPRAYNHRPGGSISSRGGRGSFSNQNQPRLVDPNSFSRFSQDRFPPRSYPPKSVRRPSTNSAINTRHFSGRSNEGYQPQRDRPSDTPTRPTSMEQPPLVPASALERRIDAGEPVQPTLVQETSHAPIDNPEHPLNTVPSTPVSDDDPNWACTEYRIGHSRPDVLGLIAGNIPPELGDEELNAYLVREVNCTRVASPNNHSTYPKMHARDRIIFINFHDPKDARFALGRRDLKVKGTSIMFKVPWKYWRRDHPDYRTPSQIKARADSGLPPFAQYTGRPRRISNTHFRQPSFDRYSVHLPAGLRMPYPGAFVGVKPGSMVPPAEYDAPDVVAPPNSLTSPSVPVVTPSHVPSGNTTEVDDAQSQKSTHPPQNSQASEILHAVSGASSPRRKGKKKSKKPKAGTEALEVLSTLPNREKTKQASSESSPTLLAECRSKGHVEEEPLTYTSVVQAGNSTSHNVAASVTSDTPTASVADSATTQSPSLPQWVIPALSSTHVTTPASMEHVHVIKTTTAPVSAISSVVEVPNQTLAHNDSFTEATKDVSDRGMDVSQERRSSSSKAADDVDESFQTAVETPESIKIVVSTEIGDKDTGANTIDSTDHGTFGAESSSTEQSPIPRRSVSTDDTNLLSELVATASSHPAVVVPKQLELPKAGPKVTESLSPFARQGQAKKKEKKSKSTKGKNKSQAETASQDQDSKRLGDAPSTQSDAAKEDSSAFMTTSHADTTMKSSTTASKVDELTPKVEQTSTPVLTKLRARLTDALSGINASKSKGDTSLAKVSQAHDNTTKSLEAESGGNDAVSCSAPVINEDVSGQTSTANLNRSKAETSQTQPQVESVTFEENQAEPATMTQLTEQASGRKKKPKRNKRKSKAKKAEAVPAARDDEVSSTETLTHETSTSPNQMEAALNLLSLSEHTQASMDNTTNAEQSQKKGNVGLVPKRSFGTLRLLRPAPRIEEVFSNLGVNQEVHHLREEPSKTDTVEIETSEEIEQSKQKMQEMAHQERLIKLRQKTDVENME